MDTDFEIIDKVTKFYKDSKNGQNQRFRSWDHCYNFFRGKKINHDLACLHLAFYLASWGMYRASSRLLQTDYLIHSGVVKEILKPKYSILRGVSLDDLSGEEAKKMADKIFDLIEKISNDKQYARHGVSVTDTLVSKILLGTLGCIPAYDRFFVAGLRRVGSRRKEGKLKYSNFVHNRGRFIGNYLNLVTFCKEHERAFSKVDKGISKRGNSYPLMKLVDMYFWTVGEGLKKK